MYVPDSKMYKCALILSYIVHISVWFLIYLITLLFSDIVINKTGSSCTVVVVPRSGIRFFRGCNQWLTTGDDLVIGKAYNPTKKKIVKSM